MSVTAISWAWKQALSRNILPELLALADNANDLGICWVKVSTVAEKTKTSERTVQRNLTKLAELGMLEIIERRLKGSGNRCNLYLLPLPEADRKAQEAFIHEMTTGTFAIRRGDTSVTQGVTPMSPRGDASVTHNHKNESSLKGSITTGGGKPADPKGPAFIPESWIVPDKVRQSLKEKGYTDQQIDTQEVLFKVYWEERRDAKAKKASWGMAFINWMNIAGKEKASPEGPANSRYKPNRGEYGRAKPTNASGADLLGEYADRYEANCRGESTPESGDTIEGEFIRQ